MQVKIQDMGSKKLKCVDQIHFWGFNPTAPSGRLSGLTLRGYIPSGRFSGLRQESYLVILVTLLSRSQVGKINSIMGCNK